MTEPIGMGLLAATLAVLPGILRELLPKASLDVPVAVLLITVLAAGFQYFLFDRKLKRTSSSRYDGVADLLVHVHAPSQDDQPLFWSIRGLISFFLSLVGGIAGPEGAAVELTHGMIVKFRSPSVKWFEQRRRSDAATALAAGVSAAFGAPFGATLFAAEVGLGGRLLSIALGSVVAFVFSKLLLNAFAFYFGTRLAFDISGALSDLHINNFHEWLGVVGVAALSGLIGAFIVRFLRFSRTSLDRLTAEQGWLRIFFGGFVIFIIVMIFKRGFVPSSDLLEQVLWTQKSVSEVGVILVAHLLILSLTLTAFGTVGVLWPLFALGGYFGFLVNHVIFSGIPGFSAMAGLMGGAAFFGAVLGAPLSGALIAFELTQNLNVLLPCVVAGFGARKICSWLKTRPILAQDLESRGVALVEGRTEEILKSIQVQEAMVTDFETIDEKEPVSAIYSRLIASRYPFLPVINSQRVFLGLITVDMIQDAWATQDPLSSNIPLASLLEAKDLLYRSGWRPTSVKASDPLTLTSGLFDSIPCVAVVDGQKKIAGLLFVHGVRLAYDREVARRTLAAQMGGQGSITFS